MSKDFKAIIREESPRYREWMQVMGTNEFPIKSPIPGKTVAADKESLVYLIDLEELTPEQRERLVKHLSAKFEVDEGEVVSDLDKVGCPILDSDVTIVVHNPQKWF